MSANRLFRPPMYQNTVLTFCCTISTRCFKIADDKICIAFTSFMIHLHLQNNLSLKNLSIIWALKCLSPWIFVFDYFKYLVVVNVIVPASWGEWYLISRCIHNFGTRSLDVWTLVTIYFRLPLNRVATQSQNIPCRIRRSPGIYAAACCSSILSNNCANYTRCLDKNLLSLLWSELDQLWTLFRNLFHKITVNAHFEGFGWYHRPTIKKWSIWTRHAKHV